MALGSNHAGNLEAGVSCSNLGFEVSVLLLEFYGPQLTGFGGDCWGFISSVFTSALASNSNIPNCRYCHSSSWRPKGPGSLNPTP